MNREPEYRGKRVDNGEWVYGNYHANEAKDTHFILIPYILKWHPNAPEITCVGYNVIPSTVGQYTGRKDTHENKLFGGDIVSGKWPYASKGVIVWDNARCGFFIKPMNAMGKASYDPYYKMNSVKNILQIGTIHDPKEQDDPR